MVSKKLQRAIVIASLGLSVALLESCSGSDESEQEELAKSEDGENPAEAPTNGSEAPLVQGNEQPVNTVGDTAPPSNIAPPPPPDAAQALPPDPIAAPAPPGGGGIAAADRNAMSVMFVPSSASVHAQPDRNSPTARTLGQGDHVLVKMNGEWAQTSAGEFIAAAELSSNPVGRKRSPSSWRGL